MPACCIRTKRLCTFTDVTMSIPAAQALQKSSLSTLKGLLPFLAPYKREFLLAGIALVVAAGATLAIPYAFKQMIDLGFGATGSGSIQHVNTYFLALFGVASVLAIATSVRFTSCRGWASTSPPISAARFTVMSSA